MVMRGFTANQKYLHFLLEKISQWRFLEFYWKLIMSCWNQNLQAAPLGSTLTYWGLDEQINIDLYILSAKYGDCFRAKYVLS